MTFWLKVAFFYGLLFERGSLSRGRGVTARKDTPHGGQAGTHPNGMLSCLVDVLRFNYKMTQIAKLRLGRAHQTFIYTTFTLRIKSSLSRRFKMGFKYLY